MPEYAKLKTLVAVKAGRKASKAQLGRAANGLATALKKERATGSLRIGVLERGRFTSMDIEHGGGKAKVTKSPTGRPTCEILGSSKTLGEIAAGRLSPVDAYLQGKLRIRGDLKYAKRVYARSAQSKGKRDI